MLQGEAHELLPSSSPWTSEVHFLLGFFHDAITPASASVEFICLSVAVPLIISPREHMAEQHDSLCGCD